MTRKKAVSTVENNKQEQPRKKTKQHYEGHRERLRKRFMDTGGTGFFDYELLELLLFRSLPRSDTKPLAKNLLEHFGSLADVLNSDPHLLKQVPGCGSAIITDLKLIRKLHERMCEMRFNARDIFKDLDKVIAYLQASLAHLTVEQFRVMYLDKKFGLIKEEIHQIGTVDQTAVYPREVIKRALELAASSLILVHNHPSGSLEPSIADIHMTAKLIETAAPFNINILEHFIISREGYASFKDLNLIA